MWWFTYYHVLQYKFMLVNVWSKSEDEEDALMKAVGKVVGLTGDSMVRRLYGILWAQHTDSILWVTNYH